MEVIIIAVMLYALIMLINAGLAGLGINVQDWIFRATNGEMPILIILLIVCIGLMFLAVYIPDRKRPVSELEAYRQKKERRGKCNG